MGALKWSGSALALALAIVPAQGEDAPTPNAALAFGAREDVEQASLSPDGRKLAFVRPLKGQGAALMILDLIDSKSPPVSVARAEGHPDRLSDCRWVSNARLMCTIYGITRIGSGLTYSSRIIAVDSDGKRLRTFDLPGYGRSLSSGSVVDWNPGVTGAVLMARPRSDGMTIDRVDTLTSKWTQVERIHKNASEFISDGQGTIRIIGRLTYDGNGYQRPGTRYYYRLAGSKELQPLSVVMPDRAGFDPYGVDATRDVAFGLKRVDGRIAAYSMALDGSGKEELLFAHPQVDVDGFARIGRRGRIVGATYATDRREVKYFDPALEKLAADLGKALSATPLIRFVDSSEDETLMLLWAGADNNPGQYYLFDRKARKLHPVLDKRPQLFEAKLASMKHVTYPASDGTGIPGYLTLPHGRTDAKGLPALVMPHGGPGARDEWGFDWLAQYFASQGYAVLQPNFRGSTGYGDAWFQKNGFQGWRLAIGDVNDAGRWLIREGADAKRLGIFGWSYGGYAALQSTVLDPDLFKAIVAVAPVTDLERLREEGRNWSNFRLTRDFIGAGPHIAEGSPSRHAAQFKAPVLMFHGDLDRNVDVDQGKLMQSRLERAGRKSELVVYPGLDHYLEDSEARTDMLTKAGAFLKASMGG